MPKHSMPLAQVGWPERFALVDINGCASLSSSAFATFDFDCRIAMRPVLPVTFSGTREDAGAMMVNAPGQK